jgi:uncharacterized damage-inducible protein DinB
MILERLAGGLEGLDTLLQGSTPAELTYSPEGKWSALQNLAHLGRYYEVFAERIERMLHEDQPSLPRYRAEEDPGFAAWLERSPDEVIRDLKQARKQMLERVQPLDPASLERTGIHPLLGAMPLRRWLEFFLVHEGHHLYTVVLRLGEARQKGVR